MLERRFGPIFPTAIRWSVGFLPEFAVPRLQLKWRIGEWIRDPDSTKFNDSVNFFGN